MSPLLILGASTRSAAHSAIRAGLRPICADRFADEDLRAVAEVLEVQHFPRDLPSVTQRVPPCPWIYTGALENSPEMIAHISAGRPLWGNPADVVTAVRDPERLYAALSADGLPALEVRPESHPPPPDGRWMLKPRRSAAGRGITPWTPKARRSPTLNKPHYFQPRVLGGPPPLAKGGQGGSVSTGFRQATPCGPPSQGGQDCGHALPFDQGVPPIPISALFLASAEGARMIGIARQWVGEKWLGAPPFRYCGSIGPIQLAEELQRTVRLAGEVLAEEFRLRGLFGIDFLCDGREVYLTEVNPRYTASVEVFEHAFGVPLLDWHRRTFVNAESKERRAESRSRQWDNRTRGQSDKGTIRLSAPVVGKAILYAERDLIIPRLEEFTGEVAVERLPYIADRPSPGSRIQKGAPLCTVLASGDNEAQCRENVTTQVHALRTKMKDEG